MRHKFILILYKFGTIYLEKQKMLKEYLIENYGYNEPIFLNELSIEGMSKNALRQAIKRLNKSGFLKRYDNGIYYIPKSSGVLSTSYLDPLKVITYKYIENEKDKYGYLTGLSFANQLGLSTQMSSVIEIVSNNEATRGRIVTIGNQKVKVEKPNIEVTNENASLLQLLDMISSAEKYSELSEEETYDVLKKYIKDNKFSKKQLIDASSSLTGNTSKRLIEWGIVYEFI